MFDRLSGEGLPQTSHLIACERTRTAVVIDPQLDIDAYISTATKPFTAEIAESAESCRFFLCELGALGGERLSGRQPQGLAKNT